MQENKSDNQIEQLLPTRVIDEIDENNSQTIDLGDDPGDVDYIPELTELGTLHSESGDMQIKVEVLEEDVTDKVLGKKRVVQKKKISVEKSDMPALIPAMVNSKISIKSSFSFRLEKNSYFGLVGY